VAQSAQAPTPATCTFVSLKADLGITVIRQKKNYGRKIMFESLHWACNANWCNAVRECSLSSLRLLNCCGARINLLRSLSLVLSPAKPFLLFGVIVVVMVCGAGPGMACKEIFFRTPHLISLVSC
jgi:hypothetical protein